MMREVYLQPLTEQAFAPFGDVLTVSGQADMIINEGACERFHDRAQLDFGAHGRAGISIFNARPRSLPYTFELIERHPEGSQAFIPMHAKDWLVIVAHDDNGKPGEPLAFLASGMQGINFHKGIWHGVLTPLHAPGLFAVVDRIGNTPNLEEYRFDLPYVVRAEG